MWWKFLTRLAFGLFLGAVAVAPLFLTAQEQRKHLQVVHDHSSHIFSHLTAEEINRRTLKAAAAIDRSHRQY
jgi:4-amino-4-deoxy-L-arabinose transferase-like glycosyltransferase